MTPTEPSRRGFWKPALGVLVVVCSCVYVVGQLVAQRPIDPEVTLHRPLTAADQNREGEDWPRFLGLSEQGVSGETGLLEKWPETGPPILWEREVGTGYSAPSVLGNQLVLHHRLGDEEVVECMRADNGQPIWDYRYPTSYEDPYGYNNGPRCSPILTERYCYTYGAEGVLTCLKMDSGQLVWSRSIRQDFQLPDWFFGVGCSPVLEGDLLIALVGGQPNSGVVAFDAETGKTVWEAVGKQTWDGVETEWSSEPTYRWTGEEMVVSYSSPVVATIHGKRHLLCLVRHGLVSLDPQTGRENFKYWFRPRVHESVNAARPLVIGDRIFLSSAYKQGSALLRVNPDGASYKVEWRDQRNMLTHWSTAIHVDGYIYGFSGRHERDGELRCLDLKTGQVQWAANGSEPVVDKVAYDQTTGRFVDRKSGREVTFPFYGRASKIQVGDRFIVLGERGTLSLVKINPEKFEELARASYKQIHYPVWTAPVLSRKRLYLRCEDAMLCLDLAPPQ